MFDAFHSLPVTPSVDGVKITPCFSDVKNPRSCSELASIFSQDLSSAIDRIFPIVKVHCTDKLWMTPSLKQLISERQRAFHSGDRNLWRHYRSKVKKEISLKKRWFYITRCNALNPYILQSQKMMALLLRLPLWRGGVLNSPRF